jgi:hypothetical protein
MVLENASGADIPDSFVDSAPSSDNDPYSDSDSQPATTGYHIDRTNFPKPIPLVGQLFGYNDKLFSTVLNTKIQNAAQHLKRPLTQEEAQSFAYWTAKQISVLSYGAPIGVAGGLWRAYSTADKFRFPFFQPNLEKFNPTVWPSPRFAALKGQRAVMAWHALRMAAYGTVGNFLGQLFFGSYSMSVAAVGEMSDPRLKDFVEMMRAQAQQKRGALQNPTMRQPGTMGQKQGALAAAGNKQQDDASPTGGMFFEDIKDTESNTGTTSESNRSTRPQGRGWPKSRPAPAQRQSQETQDKPFDAFDDASPTNEQTTAAGPAPSGSAWDRIRRGEKTAPIAAKPGSSSQPSSQSAWAKQQNAIQGEQREGSTTGDSFAFSKTDEERNYAKEEAQKEFDARVEQERRGGDFSRGSGDQKRW